MHHFSPHLAIYQYLLYFLQTIHTHTPTLFTTYYFYRTCTSVHFIAPTVFIFKASTPHSPFILRTQKTPIKQTSYVQNLFSNSYTTCYIQYISRILYISCILCIFYCILLHIYTVHPIDMLLHTPLTRSRYNRVKL